MAGSLRQALAHNFSVRTRMKGDEYVASNRVQIESGFRVGGERRRRRDRHVSRLDHPA